MIRHKHDKLLHNNVNYINVFLFIFLYRTRLNESQDKTDNETYGFVNKY